MQPQEERKFDPTPLYTSPADLERVLFSMTEPNTEVVKESTSILKEFFKKQESITCLIQQIAESTKPEVRQMAAVYLREQVETFWRRLPEDMQQNLKTFLLQKMVGEATNPERLAIGSVVSSVGRLTVPKGKWNDLLPALEQLCAADKATNVREVSYLLWRNLVTYCGTSIKSHFLTILGILDQGLQDQSSGKIQVEAVKTIGAMVEFMDNEEEVSVLRGFIPKMVKVVENCLERQEEDNVVDGMSVFTDLMESDIPILNQHGLELCHFMARICAAKDLPLSVRRQGASFLSWAVKSRPKTMVKNGLVQPLVQLCANLVIESQGYDPDATAEDDGGEDIRLSGSTLGFACDLLDEVFLNIPVETSFPLAISATESLLPSEDPGQRKGAYVTMAMMAEGCAEIIVKDNNLENLLRRCIRGLEDPDEECRKCACEALTQMATHVPIEILKYHELIMTPLFTLLKNTNEQLRVKERALGTVEMIVEDIDDPETLRPYLADLMQTLAFCMNVADKSIQEQALSTLSSVASTAKDDFHPFFDQVVGLLKQIISITDPEMLSLRGEATACLGAVATAVGRERFTPVMQELHPIILAGFELNVDVADVRENSFMYFADLASILGPELYNLDNFRDVLDHILLVMEDDDGMMVKLPDDGFGPAQPNLAIDDEDLMEGGVDIEELDEAALRALVAAAEEGDELDELDDHLGEIRTLKLQVASGFMEEKAAAIHALTQIAKFCGPAFLQSLEEVWEHILVLWEYPHALVKIALSGCIQEIIKLVLKTMHNTTKLPWMVGDVSIKYDDNTSKLIGDIFPMVIQSIHDEDDRDALTVILDNFMEQLKMLGPSAVQPYMEELCRAINMFLKEKTSCFSTKNEDDDTKTIAGKHRWVADSVAELIGVLAQLWGPTFVQQFQEFFPNILTFADPSRHPHDQAMAAGCIADVTSYLAQYNIMKPFAADSFQLAIRVAQAEETNMRQNGLYLIGALWTACDQSCTLPFAQSSLQIVGQYIQFPNTGARAQTLVRDNAVSALGKMMVSDPDTVPFSQYLQTWLQALPLTADFSENKYIYALLTDLITKHTSVMEQYMQVSLHLLADGLTTVNTEEDTKRHIAMFFKSTQANPSFAAVISSLPENLQLAVAQASAAV